MSNKLTERGEIVVRLHKKDMEVLAELTAEHLKRLLTLQDQLLNLTALAKELGMSYGSLANKDGLPYHTVGRNGRKMYRLREVIDHLRIKR